MMAFTSSAALLLLLLSPGTTRTVDARPQAGQRGSAIARSAEVLASEEVIENLRTQMAVLSSSAANLRVPDRAARGLFQAVVRVKGLGPAPSSPRADSLGLELPRLPVRRSTQGRFQHPRPLRLHRPLRLRIAGFKAYREFGRPEPSAD